MAIYTEILELDGMPYAVMMPDDETDQQFDAWSSRNSPPSAWQSGLPSLFRPDDSRYQDSGDTVTDLTDIPNESHWNALVNRSPAYANSPVLSEMYFPTQSGRADMSGDDASLGTWGTCQPVGI